MFRKLFGVTIVLAVLLACSFSSSPNTFSQICGRTEAVLIIKEDAMPAPIGKGCGQFDYPQFFFDPNDIVGTEITIQISHDGSVFGFISVEGGYVYENSYYKLFVRSANTFALTSAAYPTELAGFSQGVDCDTVSSPNSSEGLDYNNAMDQADDYPKWLVIHGNYDSGRQLMTIEGNQEERCFPQVFVRIYSNLPIGLSQDTMEGTELSIGGLTPGGSLSRTIWFSDDSTCTFNVILPSQYDIATFNIYSC